MKRLIFFIVISVSLFACNKNQLPDLRVGFKTNESQVTESKSKVNIPIALTTATDVNMQITYSRVGTALEGADYILQSKSPIIIPSGSTGTIISLTLVDDKIIEPVGKSVVFKITSTNTGSIASNSTFTLSILDNDVVPTNAMQIDLVWDIGQGKDINDVDLDLMIATNVVVKNSFVQTYKVFKSSTHKQGFESIVLNYTDPDQVYYIAPLYKSGTASVKFELHFHGGYKEQTIADTFEPNMVGNGFFFGPITKKGGSFTKIDTDIIPLK